VFVVGVDATARKKIRERESERKRERKEGKEETSNITGAFPASARRGARVKEKKGRGFFCVCVCVQVQVLDEKKTRACFFVCK
jgi:hypothetical protein